MEDVELPEMVQRLLDEAGIGGRVRVEATSMPGIIRLTGTVVSEEERLRADQAARSAEDVLEVIDEIQISRSSSRHHPAGGR